MHASSNQSFPHPPPHSRQELVLAWSWQAALAPCQTWFHCSVEKVKPKLISFVSSVGSCALTPQLLQRSGNTLSRCANVSVSTASAVPSLTAFLPSKSAPDPAGSSGKHGRDSSEWDLVRVSTKLEVCVTMKIWILSPKTFPSDAVKCGTDSRKTGFPGKQEFIDILHVCWTQTRLNEATRRHKNNSKP